MSTRVGLYEWAGPGTIRMIDLKFFSPRIDTESLMRAYDYDRLAAMQEKFGITDVWATYSWGFSDEREEEDRRFLEERVENFKKLGLTLHAYIQGANLVYEDFAYKDWFAHDERGRLIPYHRGRKVTCLNNPGFREYIAAKIRAMRDKGFDGVFIDNIQMGQLALGAGGHKKPPIAFAGCSCLYCRIGFHEETSFSIPRHFKKGDDRSLAYLEFRTRSTSRFLEMAAQETHAGGMLFGSNSFDPAFHTELVFGTDLAELARIQDYLLFENHSFPVKGVSRNAKSEKIACETDKPVFVVSYKHGIGHDAAPKQYDLDLLFSEAAHATFNACLKGSEYVTRGTWHNLDASLYRAPDTSLPIRTAAPKKRHLDQRVAATARLMPPLKYALRSHYNRLLTQYMESKRFRQVMGPAYRAAVR